MLSRAPLFRYIIQKKGLVKMTEQWLKQLYDANYDMLYRLAANRLVTGMGHCSDVQDVLQEVFLLAFFKQIDTHPNPEGWLVITTVNICRNYVQSNARQARRAGRCVQVLLDRDRKSGDDTMKSADIRVSLEQVLTQEEYDLFVQYCEGGRTLDALAKDMNLSPNALRVRIFRIRKKLQKIFANM